MDKRNLLIAVMITITIVSLMSNFVVYSLLKNETDIEEFNLQLYHVSTPRNLYNSSEIDYKYFQINLKIDQKDMFNFNVNIDHSLANTVTFGPIRLEKSIYNINVSIINMDINNNIDVSLNSDKYLIIYYFFDIIQFSISTEPFEIISS